MTPIQNLWLTIFNFGPAIILGIYKQWWVGLIALAATAVISWVLMFAIFFKLPHKAKVAWSWVKPPVIAALIVGAGWQLF